MDAIQLPLILMRSSEGETRRLDQEGRYGARHTQNCPTRFRQSGLTKPGSSMGAERWTVTTQTFYKLARTRELNGERRLKDGLI